MHVPDTVSSVEIVLGVTGGIAAYKAAEVVRGLRRAGAGVTVVMTSHAEKFITPLTLQTLSGRRVITSHFDLAAPGADAGDVEHIGLARDCGLLLIAPATASILAKMAHGLADDFLSTFYLAVTCPVMVAPAMNTKMWEHPATRENLARLKRRGVIVVDPEVGPLASVNEGVGAGRLASPEVIVTRALDVTGWPARGPVGAGLSGMSVLVTAGPTREALDPVRYLSNPSTGKMGFAVAEAARDLGATVVLVTGPTSLPDPPGMTTLRVESARQMREAVMQRLPDCSVVVKAAAVSDFRPAREQRQKAKKDEAELTLALERTPDILSEIAKAKGKRFLVGFAAETEDLVKNARRKLADKHLDLIVANKVATEKGRSGNGAFGAGTNEVVILGKDGMMERWPRMPKTEVAARLVALIAARLA